MQYLCLIYEDEKEWQKLPPAEADKVMGEFHAFTESIKRSGHYLGGNALQPTHAATTVRVRQGRVGTTDGPFAETKELVAGFWIWEVKSLAEAIEWVKRCPNPHNEDSEIEIRPFFEAEDFGEAFTPELREQEERLLAEARKRQS